MRCSVHKRAYGNTEERCLTRLRKLGRAQEGGKIFRAETQSKDTLCSGGHTEQEGKKSPCNERDVTQHEVSVL